MSDDARPTVVSASRLIARHHVPIFELIADPARQPEWDGNDNLVAAAAGQRVRSVGDTFTMMLTIGSTRVNHVVEFIEGRRIAWLPAEPDQPPPGHLWRWQLDPRGDDETLVVHTYDWSLLTDPRRLVRARDTGVERLQASLERLNAIAQSST
jgi:hypothetical protein